ncbi:MAG: hypothetical protein HDR89_01405 [Bacteroides sp.]|nr:hypothetical protein [Bacteroides sp.]
MAKKETQETRTTIDDLNDTLTKAELKVQDNKKIILWACIGIAAFVCIILLFIYAYLRPAQNKANTAYGQASQKDLIYTMNEGSLDSAAAATGLNEVISAYEAAAAKGKDGGNNARIMAAAKAYKAGDYQKALSLLKDYDRNDEIIACTSKALEGDCYVNLDKFDEAIKAFKDAAKIADGNPTLTPYCLLKEATVLHHLGKYAEEAELYKEILDRFPEYGAQTNENYEAFYQRALKLAQAKK